MCLTITGCTGPGINVTGTRRRNAGTLRTREAGRNPDNGSGIICSPVAEAFSAEPKPSLT